MLEILVRVDAPAHMAQAVKECLCMRLETYGDTRTVSVRVVDGELSGPERPGAPTRYYQERIPTTGGR